MTIDELNQAMESGCPVSVCDVVSKTEHCGFVNAIIDRYGRGKSQHIISAEIIDTIGRSVTIASPKNIKFWYPVKEGENK